MTPPPRTNWAEGSPRLLYSSDSFQPRSPFEGSVSWSCSSLLAEGTLAGDLFRLRLSAPQTVYPGSQFSAIVLIDHDEYPAGTGSGVDYSLRAFSFGLEVPGPLQYDSYTWDNTIVDQLVGGPPFFEAVYAVNGGVTTGMVLTADLQTIPPGLSQHAIVFIIDVPVGAQPGPVELDFAAGMGDKEVPVHFVTPEGKLIPKTKGATVFIAGGAAASGGPALGAMIPAPTIVPFPEPTEEELVVTWDTTEAELVVESDESGGSAPTTASGGGTAGASGDPLYCDYVVGQSLPAYPSATIQPGGDPPSVPNPIHDAMLNVYPGGNWILYCEAGVYRGYIEIDASQLSGEVIIVAVEGPGKTTIDAEGVVPSRAALRVFQGHGRPERAIGIRLDTLR